MYLLQHCWSNSTNHLPGFFLLKLILVFLYFFFSAVDFLNYLLAGRQGECMSYTASYDCIFVLFSLLGDNFFHYILECMFHYSFFFKEVENFFFLIFFLCRNYCIINAKWQRRDIISWSSPYWETKRILWLFISGSFKCKFTSRFRRDLAFDFLPFYLSILWKHY